MSTTSLVSRALLPFSLVLSLLCACGGGGPDTSQAGTNFVDQVNLEAEGKAKLVSFGEKTRKSETMEGIEFCAVEFEGELEFTDRCYYYMRERKQGEHLKFDATVEYQKDENGWRQIAAGIYPVQR